MLSMSATVINVTFEPSLGLYLTFSGMGSILDRQQFTLFILNIISAYFISTENTMNKYHFMYILQDVRNQLNTVFIFIAIQISYKHINFSSYKNYTEASLAKW